MSGNLSKAIRSAKASLAVEGQYLTPEEETLIKEKLEGQITDEEFHKRVLDMIK